ncbi:Circadian-associated transcriptional repressor [Lemmus lemmus]
MRKPRRRVSRGTVPRGTLVAGSELWHYRSRSSASAPGLMDSPSSVSSCSSSSLSSSFSTSPVNSDFSFPSDNEREAKSAHGLRPEAVGQRGGAQPSPGPIRCRHRPRVSGNQHTASHLEQRGSRVKRSRTGELETSLHTQGCITEGDLLFAQKCKELQGFIRPLTELLNGLKMGRFDRGLSSFQQSVAMDRIQRIVGVLRKPQMGERYLGTLLQVEGMLKTWFPHIAAQKSSLGGSRHQINKDFPSHHSGLSCFLSCTSHGEAGPNTARTCSVETKAALASARMASYEPHLES